MITACDLRVLQRGRGVDRDDPGVGERAAQDRAVEHPGQLDVVDVAALPADEAGVLLAPQAAEADRALADRLTSRRSASSTATLTVRQRPQRTRTPWSCAPGPSPAASTFPHSTHT